MTTSRELSSQQMQPCRGCPQSGKKPCGYYELIEGDLAVCNLLSCNRLSESLVDHQGNPLRYRGFMHRDAVGCVAHTENNVYSEDSRHSVRDSLPVFRLPLLIQVSVMVAILTLSVATVWFLFNEQTGLAILLLMILGVNVGVIGKWTSSLWNYSQE